MTTEKLTFYEVLEAIVETIKEMLMVNKRIEEKLKEWGIELKEVERKKPLRPSDDLTDLMNLIYFGTDPLDPAYKKKD